MTRGRSSSAPKYRLHKASGQARVTIRGTTFYLGKHGSEQSHQKYKQLLADEWNPGSSSQTPPLNSAAVPVTVTDLAIEYAKFVKRKFGDNSNEWKQVRLVLKSIRGSYGHLLANEFGPVRLENYRQTLVARGLSRAVIKRKSNYVKKMYQNAVRYELIPVELWQSLCALGPVEMQDTPRRKIGPADPDIVKATQLELTPVLRDMVEVHKLIGARPSEICNMRPCDIDRTNDIWVYTPTSHKTESYGHSREILIGPRAQATLQSYLDRPPTEYCFTPAESYQQHYERRSENRKTPLNEGNVPRPRKPRTFRPNFNKDSYRRAIERAVLRAFPMSNEVKSDEGLSSAWKAKYVWKPNQLRKAAATIARKHMDLETAQVVLGHSSKKTTERYYAGIDNDRGIAFARKFG